MVLLLLLLLRLRLLPRLDRVVRDAHEASYDRLLRPQQMLQQRHQVWGYWVRGIRDARRSALAVACCRRDGIERR